MNTWMAIFLLQIAAFWPVWQWYAKRLWAGNADDQWCLLATVTAIVLLLAERNTIGAVEKHEHRKGLPGGTSETVNLFLPMLLMLLYAFTFHWLPPLLRAVIAVVAVGVTMSQMVLRRFLPLPITGLLFLALPTIPLLQFYLGFPLRVVVGALTAPLLQFSGLAVVQDGTALNWNGQLIAIDAPCSGIRMLWAALFLLCIVTWFYRLNVRKALLAAVLSFVMIVIGNILRAAALFYLEARLVQLPINPDIAHESIGIVTFVFVALGIVAVAAWLQRFHFRPSNTVCETSSHSFLPVS